MVPHGEIDALIAARPDWRGAVLADARRIILGVDAGIVERWKWMGAPVWELDGILVVQNIFKKKVKLGFMYGASLDHPSGIFNGELGGNQRRSVKYLTSYNSAPASGRTTSVRSVDLEGA